MSDKETIKNAVQELGQSLKDYTNPTVAKLAGGKKPLKSSYISGVRNGAYTSRNVAYWMAVFALRKAALLIGQAKKILFNLGEDVDEVVQREMTEENGLLKEAA